MCPGLLSNSTIPDEGHTRSLSAVSFTRRYYLSGTDAYRLKLLFPLTDAMVAAQRLQQLSTEQGDGPVSSGVSDGVEEAELDNAFPREIVVSDFSCPQSLGA